MAASPQLPLDIYLLIFDQLGDPNVLWSTCRNVSHFLRDCVDEYFRHGALQKTFIDLLYSDIHTQRGPFYSCIHVPMVFDRFSKNGRQAVFQQREYIVGGCNLKGSVRGWVPFIERYCAETQKPKPKVLYQTRVSSSLPLWEQDYSSWRSSLFGDAEKNHLKTLRDMTSIGRGDRPPYYIKVYDGMNDTELVDLVIDCKRREISFDWRATFSKFFLEQTLGTRVSHFPKQKRTFDEDLTILALPYSRPRHKRLAPWIAKNKHRMTPEVRMWTANLVESELLRVQPHLRHDNLIKVGRGREGEEVVPAKLAGDYPDLLFWHWNEDGVFVPKRRGPQRPNNCVVL